jgi:hypothetical protein
MLVPPRDFGGSGCLPNENQGMLTIGWRRQPVARLEKYRIRTGIEAEAIIQLKLRSNRNISSNGNI